MTTAQFPDEQVDGAFARQEAAFTNWVTAAGSSGFPAVAAPADEFAECGRGLHLVRALADDVVIEPSRYGTQITVLFHRAATAARNAGASSALSSA